MDQNLAVKLQEWKAAAETAKAAKELEMALRKECLSIAFPDGEIGTNTMALEQGWKLKGVYKLNYSFDEAALDAVLANLREEHKVVTDDLVRIKKEPAMTAIKKLSKEHRLILDQALVSKSGTPTLELVAPKEKKK